MSNNQYPVDENSNVYYENNTVNGKKIKYLVRYANLTGSAKRKFIRANTVHLRGTCPVCETANAKFHKVVYVNKNDVKHNVWVCSNKDCKSLIERKDLLKARYA